MFEETWLLKPLGERGFRLIHLIRSDKRHLHQQATSTFLFLIYYAHNVIFCEKTRPAVIPVTSSAAARARHRARQPPIHHRPPVESVLGNVGVSRPPVELTRAGINICAECPDEDGHDGYTLWGW